MAKAEDYIEALTPSGDTKAEYIGEFSFDYPMYDGDGHPYREKINIPWTSIKEIMSAIKNRAEMNKPAEPFIQPCMPKSKTK